MFLADLLKHHFICNFMEFDYIFPMLSIPQFLTNWHKAEYITNFHYVNFIFLNRKILSNTLFLANLLILFCNFSGFDSKMQNDFTLIFLEIFSWIQYTFENTIFLIFFISMEKNNLYQTILCILIYLLYAHFLFIICNKASDIQQGNSRLTISRAELLLSSLL